tara:strand:- start:221 stop:490 length:270 start_codon:yes stop_codon:yes gene_type:complete
VIAPNAVALTKVVAALYALRQRLNNLQTLLDFQGVHMKRLTTKVYAKILEDWPAFACGFILGAAFMASPAIAVFLMIGFIFSLAYKYSR